MRTLDGTSNGAQIPEFVNNLVTGRLITRLIRDSFFRSILLFTVVVERVRGSWGIPRTERILPDCEYLYMEKMRTFTKSFILKSESNYIYIYLQYV